VAWGEALVHCILESYTFCAAHPTPSFIPPPLNPYNRLLADILMERDEDMEKAEMEDRETEDRGVESKLYVEQGNTGGSAEISLDIPVRLIENRTQCDPPFFNHSNAITATASGPVEASTEHKVRRMPMRKQLHTDKTGCCQKQLVNFVINIVNEHGDLKSICLSGSIIADDSTAEEQS
jgi:hypothetical protein